MKGDDGHAEEEGEEENDPIPNELDNALVHLIPAITSCGSDPSLPTYLDLATFERLAEPVLLEGGNGGVRGGGNRRHLDAGRSGEIEVAFRHCMHEAGLALVGANTGGGGGGKGGRGAGGKGGEKGDAVAGVARVHILESERMAEIMAEPMGILSLALEFVSNEARLDKSGNISAALTGLPLLLLEDFLESQGRVACKVVWSKWVEPNAEKLTKLLLMKNSGKYTLIRLCKKLANRMSKTHDSSFCGQIHMFLAKALEFFERSGLNVTGGVNLDNVTAFEDEKQFRRAMMGFDGEGAASKGLAAAATTEAGGDAMEVDSSPGTAAVGGARTTDKGFTAASTTSAAPEEFAVDYPLYRSFWRLQKYALQQEKAVKGDNAKETWEALLGDVDKILGAFEANAFSEHDLRLARERWAADGGCGASLPLSSGPLSSAATLKGASAETPGKRRRAAGTVAAATARAMEVDAEGGRGGEGVGKGAGPVYFGLKYLTSPRLLKLQLHDPTLRLQVLTQWLILAASLKSKVASAKDTPNSVEDLKARIELAKRLVKATPPRGEEYLSMLQIVLNRESAWTQWKDVKKCKNVEPVAVEEKRQKEKEKAAGVVAPAPSYPNKRPRPSASVAVGERAKYSPLGADFPLENMANKLRAGVPTSKEHLEDQRMCAEDPDTPASELPSASPLYTWRALRLLGRENPANLVGCYDGDLVKAMERLDKAQDEAKAAAAAAAAAAAVAAVAAAESALHQPIMVESTVAPPGGEAAATGEPAGGDLNAMAMDGGEGPKVDVKQEVAKVPAASTAAAGGIPAVTVSDASAAEVSTTSTAPDTLPPVDGGGDGDSSVAEGASASTVAVVSSGTTGSKKASAVADSKAPVAGAGTAAVASNKQVPSPSLVTRKRANKE